MYTHKFVRIPPTFLLVVCLKVILHKVLKRNGATGIEISSVTSSSAGTSNSGARGAKAPGGFGGGPSRCVALTPLPRR